MLKPCLICNSVIFSTIPYPGNPNALGFDYIQICQKCGLGYASPVKNQNELNLFYQDGNYWKEDNSSTSSIYHQSNQSRHRILFCQQHLIVKNQLNILDIGAGSGSIGYWSKSLFAKANTPIQYDFIEPDQNKGQYILAHIQKSTLHNFNQLEQKKYHLIFLNQVLEHVENPLDFINAILPSLADSGYIYLEVPFSDQLHKKDVFPHTLFFTPSSVEALCKKINLKIIAQNCFGNIKMLNPSCKIYSPQRILQHLYVLSCKMKLTKLCFFINDLLFQYNKKGELWLRYLLQKNK